MLQAAATRQVEDIRDQLAQLLYEQNATAEDCQRVAALLAASLGVGDVERRRDPGEFPPPFVEHLARYNRQAKICRTVDYD